MYEGVGHDLVFAPEPGQREDAGNGQGAHQKRGVGPRNPVAQPAHLPDVLLARHGMDDGTGREKEQGFEVGMGRQVEDGGRIGADPTGQEHVSELAHRGIGQHALDVGLDQPDRRRK